MLFKMALNNVKKSMRDYTIYFLTLLTGVAVFYVFNSIEAQTVFLEISEEKKELVQSVIQLVSGVSVLVSAVLGLLIVYATRFLLKRRNREFAVYLTLGMGKTKVSALILIETFFIGIFSLAAGLIAGIAASQFMSAFTADLFDADMTDYKFMFSGKAAAKTVLYFSLIYIVVMALNSYKTGKTKLIDLIQADRKSEKNIFGNPVISIIAFIAGASMLVYSYYNITCNFKNENDSQLKMILILGAAGTFLVTMSFSALLLRIVSLFKNTYFKNINCFTFRQISSNINTMSVSMSLICLMLFVTVTGMTASFSAKDSINTSLRTYCPADVEFQVLNKPKFDLEKEIIKKYPHFFSNFENYVIINKYIDPDLKYNTLSKKCNIALAEAYFPIYKLSEYNKTMELYGKEQLTLNENEYVVYYDEKDAEKYYNSIPAEGISITVLGKELTPADNWCRKGTIMLAPFPFNDGIIVVPDNTVSENNVIQSIMIGSYGKKTKAEKGLADSSVEYMCKETSKSLEEKYEIKTLGLATFRTEIENELIGTSSLMVFLILYIGIVFMITSGAVLALRSLSDDVDSIKRYSMLRKIGCEEKEINRSLFIQKALFFLFPMILAFFHSIFGVKFFLNNVSDLYGDTEMTGSIVKTMIMIIIIYGGYFTATYLSGKNIIKDTNK